MTNIIQTNYSSHIFTFTFKLLSLLAFYAYSYKTVLKCTFVFFNRWTKSNDRLKLRGQMIYPPFYDCLTFLIVMSSGRHSRRNVLSTILLLTHFYVTTHTKWCKLLLFTKIFAWFTSVSSFEQSRHAYMAFYVRTPWLSVNSGTYVARPGTPDVNSGTVPGIPGRLATLDPGSCGYGTGSLRGDQSTTTCDAIEKYFVTSQRIPNRSRKPVWALYKAELTWVVVTG